MDGNHNCFFSRWLEFSHFSSWRWIAVVVSFWFWGLSGWAWHWWFCPGLGPVLVSGFLKRLQILFFVRDLIMHSCWGGGSDCSFLRISSLTSLDRSLLMFIDPAFFKLVISSWAASLPVFSLLSTSNTIWTDLFSSWFRHLVISQSLCPSLSQFRPSVFSSQLFLIALRYSFWYAAFAVLRQMLS